MNDLNRCARCLKRSTGDFPHTCTPTEQWREMELTITNLRQQIAHLNDNAAGLRSDMKRLEDQSDELLAALEFAVKVSDEAGEDDEYSEDWQLSLEKMRAAIASVKGGA